MQSARAKFVNSRGNLHQTGELSSFFLLINNWTKNSIDLPGWHGKIYLTAQFTIRSLLETFTCCTCDSATTSYPGSLLIVEAKTLVGVGHVTPKIYLPKGAWTKRQITYASTFGFCTSIARSECSV